MSDRTRTLRIAGALVSVVLSGAQAAEVNEAFFTAVLRDSASDIRRLLLRGADPNQIDPQRGPALVVAAAARSQHALKALLESPETNVDIANGKDETALMQAALLGDMEVVKLLLARKAEVNKPGWTPLHYACTAGHLEVVKLLIERSAFIDAQSPNRTTPLMMAARHRHTTIVRYLIEQGADPTQRNEAGLSAADYLARAEEPELAGWVRARASEFEAKYGTINAPKPVSPPAAN